MPKPENLVKVQELDNEKPVKACPSSEQIPKVHCTAFEIPDEKASINLSHFLDRILPGCRNLCMATFVSVWERGREGVMVKERDYLIIYYTSESKYRWRGIPSWPSNSSIDVNLISLTVITSIFLHHLNIQPGHLPSQSPTSIHRHIAG